LFHRCILSALDKFACYKQNGIGIGFAAFKFLKKITIDTDEKELDIFM
jgi:hypothetical protein